MTRLKIATALVAMIGTAPAVAADRPDFAEEKPVVSFGLSFAFSKNGPVDTGLSLRVLSSNQENSTAATAGATYYFGSQTVGFDLGLAYNFENDISTAFTYDLVKKGAVFSLSRAKLSEKPDFGGFE